MPSHNHYQARYVEYLLSRLSQLPSWLTSVTTRSQPILHVRLRDRCSLSLQFLSSSLPPGAQQPSTRPATNAVKMFPRSSLDRAQFCPSSSPRWCNEPDCWPRWAQQHAALTDTCPHQQHTFASQPREYLFLCCLQLSSNNHF